jgi:hypothetical protein
MKDYYRVLGVNPGAPPEVIKAAYRALMKKHHPDVGGDPEKAKEIEEAYRNLCFEPSFSRFPKSSQPQVAAAQGREIVSLSPGDRCLDIQVANLQPNQVFTCPRECSFYRRGCRYKQALSLESNDLYALRGTTLLLHVRNRATFPQQVDCRNGRGVLVDQMGDFYHCHQVCWWQHPPKYKETGVELFPGTRATIQLWFPQLPSGRWPERFVYKHKVLVRDVRGDWMHEELIQLQLHL